MSTPVNLTSFGDISSRTAAFVVSEMLKRAEPLITIERYGQAKPLPGGSTSTMKFRRYNALSNTPKSLVEGITPDASKITYTDVSVTLTQYGDRVVITDIVEDTHEDPVLREFSGILGEQAAQMMEIVRFGVLKAGTSVFYANGTQRTDVNTAYSLALQRLITRTLKRQNAKPITKVVAPSANYGTAPIAPAFVCLTHPDLEPTLRGLSGFVAPEQYAQMSPLPGEIGKCESVRFVGSTLFEPWTDGGGTKGSYLSTSGVKADVYPMIFLGQDAFATVALKGQFAVTPTVVNKKPTDSDPLAQRTHIGWKTMQGAVILNDLWMCRAEVAILATPA